METLWNKFGEEDSYNLNKEIYQIHLFEQYKLFVEMADKISERRNYANIFFMSINTSMIGVIGFTIEKVKLVDPKYIVIIPFSAFVLFCILWWVILQSYRQLNSSKYMVIEKLEKKLPAKPYSDEWIMLGRGKNYKKYYPLASVEKVVPIAFACLYIIICVYIITNV